MIRQLNKYFLPVESGPTKTIQKIKGGGGEIRGIVVEVTIESRQSDRVTHLDTCCLHSSCKQL